MAEAAPLGVFAFQAGTAEAFAPVIRAAAARGGRVEVFSGPTALGVFESHRIPHVVSTDAAPILDWLARNAPRGILTGTSWSPEIEAEVWAAARAGGVRSAAFVDNWGGYRERFEPALKSGELPDTVAVVDEAMRLGACEALGERASVAVVGHPALEALVRESAGRDDATRASLGILPGETAVLWAADGIYAAAPPEYPTPDALGYSDAAMLEEMLPALNAIHRKKNIRLLLRRHPASPDASLAGMLDACAEFPWAVCNGLPKPAVLRASDVVAGGSSMILLEAALLGRVAISCLPAGAARFEILQNNPDLIRRAATGDELPPLFDSAPLPASSRDRFAVNAVANILSLFE